MKSNKKVFLLLNLSLITAFSLPILLPNQCILTNAEEELEELEEGDTPTESDQQKTTTKTSENAESFEDYDSSKIIYNKITAKTEGGKESETGDISTMTHEEMVQQAKGGKAYDAKSQGYANVEDKENGIMKISHDILGTDLSFNEKANFIFMLDISGSMGNTPGSSGYSMKNSVAQYLEEHLSEMNNVMGIAYTYDTNNGAGAICTDKNSIINWVRGLTIGGNESYGDTFRLGVEEINSNFATYKDRRLNTIFIGDGGHTGTSYTAYLPAYLSKIEEVTDRSKIYAIGFPGAIESELEAIATDPATTKICQNEAEFQEYLKYMQDDICRYPKSVVLNETFNTQFDILVDETHPITINGTEYKTLEEATASTGLKYDPTTKDMTFTLKEMSKDHTNETLSYYTKPTDEINGADIPVHKETYLSYVEPTNTGYAATPKKQQMETLLVTRQNSEASGELTMELEENKPLGLDSEYEYTINLENNGTLAAENVYAKLKLPEGVDFIGDLSNNLLGLSIDLHDDPEAGQENMSEISAVCSYNKETNELLLTDMRIPANTKWQFKVKVRVNGKETELPATLFIGLDEEAHLECNTLTLKYEPKEELYIAPDEEIPTEKAKEKTTGAEVQKGYAIGTLAALLLGAILIPIKKFAVKK